MSRSLAQRVREYAKKDGYLALLDQYGGIDPAVTEAAALGHDLGHPPFGHAGEQVLDELVRERGCDEGFEGNAQSFRIVTKLAFRKVDADDPPGLNLTRATLRAILKYPWIGGDRKAPKENKWGAYLSEHEDFEFAMGIKSIPEKYGQSLEAKIMDWADDITYAIHDLEDFYRVGLIPLTEFSSDSDFRRDFFESRLSDFEVSGPPVTADEVEKVFLGIEQFLPREYFRGTPGQLGQLNVMRNFLISRLVESFAVTSDDTNLTIDIERSSKILAEALKSLTRHYVIKTTELETLQIGHRKVITEVFDKYCVVLGGGGRPVLKSHYNSRSTLSSDHGARVAADYVASLTEAGILLVYRNLMGLNPGSIRDLVY